MLESAQPDSDSENSSSAAPSVPCARSSSFIRRFANNPWILAAILAAIGSQIAIIGGAVWIRDVSNNSDLRRYTQLKEILDEVRTERLLPLPNFIPVRQKATKVRNEIVPRIKRTASAQYPARQQLLWAVRDELPRMMQGDLTTVTREEREFVDRLHNVAKLLNIDWKDAGIPVK